MFFDQSMPSRDWISVGMVIDGMSYSSFFILIFLFREKKRKFVPKKEKEGEKQNYKRWLFLILANRNVFLFSCIFLEENKEKNGGVISVNDDLDQ